VKIADKTFFGVPIIETDTMTVKVEVRIRGGYLNRWLIRSYEDRSAYAVHENCIVAHPAAIDALRLQLQQKYPQCNLNAGP
jgi:hypothetical protein